MYVDYGVDQQTLLFQEQADGRKIARLPSGKVVLVHYDNVDQVQDGESWLVRLQHHDLYAVAYPIERLQAAPVAEPAPVIHTPRTTTEVIRATEAPPAPAPATTKFVPPKNRAMPEMFTRPEDRIAVFVDGANMDGAMRDAGYNLDFFRVGSFLRAKASFRAAYYYIADFTHKDPLQNKFFDFLSHSGYIVRRKPVKVIRDDDSGEERFKANVDTEIVLDMVNTADNWDVAYLLSGDSDYERCVDLLRSRGKRVYIVSSEGTLSQELRLIADKPVYFIEEYQDLLGRSS